MDNTTVEHPVLKVCLAWSGVLLAHLGIHTWSDAAAVVATIYTLILIGDYCWRRLRKEKP